MAPLKIQLQNQVYATIQMLRKLVTKPMSASLLRSIEELFTPYEPDLHSKKRVARKVRNDLKSLLKERKGVQSKAKKR